jgi:3D (Asp-Asp-Asp) domain-containing protein
MMRRVLSRYAWIKVSVLLIAMVGFVLLYETQMFDSRNAAWQSMTSADGSPLPGAQLPFSATAYCKGTTTASGVGVRTGIAAADPSLLPVGSVLNLGAGDQRYNGVYTVMDTGPKVQGRLLDLYMWSCHEALRFGRKDVQVTVLRLGWDPRATAPTLIDRLFRRREASRKVPPADPPPPAGIPPADGTPVEALDAPDEGATPEGDPTGTPGPVATPSTPSPATPPA